MTLSTDRQVQMSEEIKKIILKYNVSVMQHLEQLLYYAEYKLLKQADLKIMSRGNNCKLSFNLNIELRRRAQVIL